MSFSGPSRRRALKSQLRSQGREGGPGLVPVRMRRGGARLPRPFTSAPASDGVLLVEEAGGAGGLARVVVPGIPGVSRPAPRGIVLGVEVGVAFQPVVGELVARRGGVGENAVALVL